MGGEPTSGAIAARLQGVTGGNPFFLGEVVRVLIAEGRLGSADEAAMRRIPEEVRALIRRHVSTLSPETIGMLRVAAVLGHDLDLRVLADAGPISADRMTDAVSEAVRAGILSEDPAAPGSFAFAHDLVRETLYDDLPTIRKVELHRTAGDVLGARVPRRPRPAPGRDRAPPLAGGAVGRRRPGRRLLACWPPIARSPCSRTRTRWRSTNGRSSCCPRPRRTAVAASDILMRLGDARARSGDTVGARAVLRGGGGPVAPAPAIPRRWRAPRSPT